MILARSISWDVLATFTGNIFFLPARCVTNRAIHSHLQKVPIDINEIFHTNLNIDVTCPLLYAGDRMKQRWKSTLLVETLVFSLFCP